MRSQLETRTLPRLEVSIHIDAAPSALVDANRPVLVKGRGALDGRLVHALGAVDVVGAAIRSHAAQPGGARGRVVGAEVLDDVVLYQGVLGPPVDGQVRVAIGLVGSGVVDYTVEGSVLVKCIW